MEQQSVEVWKNTALGPRHFIFFDRLGHESSQLVRGEKTFTITTFARQINQQRAATPDLDLFRNGTFVLVKAGKETEKDEIESSDSFTDNELLSLIHEVMAKNTTIEVAILNIDSPITLGRIYEQLVMEEAPNQWLQVVKAKREEKEGGPTVVRARQAGGDGADRVPKVESDEQKGEDTASPGREIVAERVR